MTLRRRKPLKTARQRSTTLTKIGFTEKTNERRTISSIDRGYHDRPSNHRGGSVMKGYNTGKVVIGCNYQPKRSYMDDLGIFWQGYLLGQKKSLLERFRAFCGGEL